MPELLKAMDKMHPSDDQSNPTIVPSSCSSEILLAFPVAVSIIKMAFLLVSAFSVSKAINGPSRKYLSGVEVTEGGCLVGVGELVGLGGEI